MFRKHPTFWRRQRGIICATASHAFTTAGGTVVVSGEIISHSVANGNTARAGVRVNRDGTIDKREGLTFTQIDTSTDWVTPRSASVGDDYHVRFVTNVFGDPLHGDTADTWLAITSDREVYLEHATSNTSESHTVTVQISDDGGSSVLDSASYPLSAIVGTPV